MNPKLDGRPLLFARVSWIAFALLLTALEIAGQLALFQQFKAVNLTPDQLQGLAALHLNPAVYQAFNFLLYLIFPLFWAGMGLLIFWRKSDDRGALIVSALMVGAGMAATIPIWEAFAAVYPQWKWLVPLAALIGNVCLYSFFFVFPNGRYVPRWSVVVVLLLSAFNVLTSYTFALPPVGITLAERLDWFFPIFFISTLLVFLAPLYRYRRVSTTVEREQIKWVVFAIVVGVSLFAITASTVFILPNSNPDVDFTFMTVFVQPIGWTFSLLLIPLAMAVAILRFRLFEIDVLIRKTLQYSLVTAVLVSVYFGTVILLQTLLGTFVNEQSPLIIVLSTLLIVMLFNPLRRRIQGLIDGRFYRKKYNPQQVLEQFAQTARDEVDMGALTAELSRLIQETVQPNGVRVWVKTSQKSSRRD